MRGRYGIDQLYIVNLVVYFIALIIMRRLELGVIFDVLLLLLILWTFFRFFSRNIAKRQRENQMLLRLVGKVKSKTKMLFNRVKDIGTHRYRTCPHCQTKLRLPRKVGTHTVKCPRCQQRFQVKVRL